MNFDQIIFLLKTETETNRGRFWVLGIDKHRKEPSFRGRKRQTSYLRNNTIQYNTIQNLFI